MSDIVEVFLPLGAQEPLEVVAARALGRQVASIGEVRVVRRSLDARRGRTLGFRLKLAVSRPGETTAPALAARRGPLAFPPGRSKPHVVIIGAGPAGSWAALRLAEAGIAATVLERGKPVQPRRRDLARITRGDLDPDSNYCFGEGGAGTYSDGKLYTRSKDREGVAAVLADLVAFGAPPEIEVASRPHVGSNKLPKVLTALRGHLEEQGVSYRFSTQASGLRVEGGRLKAVRLAGGDEVQADAVILAVGHSARPVYAWLEAAGVALERKPLAIGVRIEHAQPLIDRLQYGEAAGHPALPPAAYEVTGQGQGRGVYSFCMCPGGWMVPAATEPGGVVVNGMSLSRRDSPFANSGLVVSIAAADFGPDADGPLAGVVFQRSIEEAAFVAGGGGFRAPAQRVGDFLGGRASTRLGRTSYRPGLTGCDLRQVFPPFLAGALREGLEDIGRRVRGYLDPEALLVAAETRTSAPVRILRDPLSLSSPSVAGLYPVGEGAGYAGGIVSAALDGIRVAERIVAAAS